jgi:hypothetical protein
MTDQAVRLTVRNLTGPDSVRHPPEPSDTPPFPLVTPSDSPSDPSDRPAVRLPPL